MADDKIIIEFDGDIKKLKQQLKAAKVDVNKLSKSGLGIGKALGSATKVAAAGFAALTGVIGGSLALYREQEQVQLKTIATIEATGKAAGLSSKEIFEMAASLQSVTTFGDEAIIGAQNLLLTFKEIGSDVFPAATETVLDMSAALGQDLKSSAIQLGKALNDPIKGVSALGRVGVQFTGEQKQLIQSLVETGDVAGAQKVILAELEGQLGGTARAAAQGTGSIEQTKNALGDIGEQIGKAALPLVSVLNTQLQGLIKSFQTSPTAVNNLRDAFEGLAKGGAFVKALFQAVGAQIGNFVATISTSIASLLEGNFRKASAQFAMGWENSFEVVKDAKKSFNDDIAAIDEAYAQKEDARENEKVVKIKQRLAEQAEAEKQARQLAFEKRVEDLQNNETMLTEEELILKQQRIEMLAEQDEIAKAEELQRQGKFDEAKKKLDDILLKKQIKNNQERINNEQKMAQARVGIAQSAANLIGAVSEQGNKAAFIAAKAAAIAQAVVATNLAAAQALAVPPAPNLPLAKAAKVAGGINIAAITATAIKGFAEGGMYTGGIPGVDSLPAMLQQGELVVPTKNFEEVIGSVQRSREAQEQGEEAQVQTIRIEVTPAEGYMDFIEQQIIERQVLNTGVS